MWVKTTRTFFTVATPNHSEILLPEFVYASTWRMLTLMWSTALLKLYWKCFPAAFQLFPLYRRFFLFSRSASRDWREESIWIWNTCKLRWRERTWNMKKWWTFWPLREFEDFWGSQRSQRSRLADNITLTNERLCVTWTAKVASISLHRIVSKANRENLVDLFAPLAWNWIDWTTHVASLKRTRGSAIQWQPTKLVLVRRSLKVCF